MSPYSLFFCSAAKEQSEESNKPLHSTMPPSTVTGGKKKHMQDDSNSESSLVESLKDAMDLAEEWLKEKRKEAGRMDDIFVSLRPDTPVCECQC